MEQNLDDMQAGSELQDITELMDELKNMVYLSDYTSEEKEVMYDMFSESLPIDEARKWRGILQGRQRDALTRVRAGELLLQKDLSKAVTAAANRDNT